MTKRWFASAGVVLGLVLVVFFVGYSFNNYDNSFLDGDLTGAIVTGPGGRQCDDTDNIHPNEGENTSSIFLVGLVRTRQSSSSLWRTGTFQGRPSLDYCVNTTFLREFYCLPNALVGSEDVRCDRGCIGGRCNFSSCIDSDANRTNGGINIGAFGSARGIARLDFLGTPPSSQSPRNYTDTCVGNVNSTRVREYYCSLGFVQSAFRNCPSNNVCSQGRCIPRRSLEICDDRLDNDGNGVIDDGCERVCDDLDDNANGLVDDGCDNDGDGYCDVEHYLFRFNYTIVGTPAVCPNGGGDCQDGYEVNMSEYSRSFSASINPGAVENCFDGYDNNCNNQTNEGCAPYLCEETDISNDPAVGGLVTIRSESGQERIWADICYGPNVVNETACPSRSLNWYSSASYVLANCPSGTTCSDPDSSTPAVCS